MYVMHIYHVQYSLMDTKDDDSEKATPSRFSYVTCILA